MATVTRRLLLGVLLLLGVWPPIRAEPPRPIRIAVDAEFGVKDSTSAQAILAGVRIAAAEINGAGGVLGRPLEVVERDNRSVPARSRANLRELAADPGVVAVFCGKYSPVVVETLPDIHALELPLLDPWAAADSITDNDYRPSYVFRLSLRDSWAVGTMLAEVRRRGLGRVGILLPHTEWGRSTLRAAETLSEGDEGLTIVERRWYNWGDASLLEHYRALQQADAQVVILVANEREGSIFAKEVAELPAAERLPIQSHWGVTGGRLFQLAGESLAKLDFSVVQTYSFIGAQAPAARRVAMAAAALFGVADERGVPAPVGVAHAYDLTHILARAITLAGSADRRAVRDALEQVRDYPGLIRFYPQPFSPERHDALTPADVFLARFAADGALEPIPAGP